MSLRSLCFILSFSFLLNVQAQKLEPIEEYLNTKKNISLKGMKVLRYWGVANLGLGIAGQISSEGSLQYFHQMNSFWGGANILISSIAIKAIKRQEYTSDHLRLELDQKKVERTFLLSSGLDLLFVGAGIGMINGSSSDNVQQERIEGYGYSVLVQGAFLLAFDTILYLLHRKNRKQRLVPILQYDYYDLNE